VSVRIGLQWSFRNPAFARVPWDELYRDHLDLIAESEALGFDDAWLSEHHFVDDGYSPSLFAIAGAVAARTTRMRIGTFLLLLPLHNAVEVAESTATLDVMSGGRFDLGVGLGYRRAEFEGYGISSRTRGKRADEGLEVIRGLLSGEKVTFEGQYVHVRDLRITPPALQHPHPPIWVGGTSPKGVDRAARLGFNYLSAGPAERTKIYDDALRSYGRDPQDFRIAAMRAVYVAPTREEAWAVAAHPLHHTAEGYVQWMAESNDEGDVHTQIIVPPVEEIIRSQSFDFFGEQALVGTPEDAVEQLEDYLSRGRITHLVCKLSLPGMTTEEIRAGMQLFARDVMPHFRERAAAA
jgi:alkanesulfonate monooxygenase SsuD/methylene tetrahydromethanopterin reductase-like flavin-dependent oxidoreductase (luciferase family)